MTMLLPNLSKGSPKALTLQVRQRRRPCIAPVGRVFPRAPDIAEEPDESLDLTAVGLSERLGGLELPKVDPTTLAQKSPAEVGTSEMASPDPREDICNTPVLPGLRGVSSDRRHNNVKPPLLIPPDFFIKGQQTKNVPELQDIENMPGGTALKKICSQLEPYLDNFYGAESISVEGEGDLTRVLFIKKMRIYLEISKKHKGPELLCVPIFHCPRCMKHWTLTGVAPENCANETEPIRGPEVLVRGRKARFIVMAPRGAGQHAVKFKLGTEKPAGTPERSKPGSFGAQEISKLHSSGHRSPYEGGRTNSPVNDYDIHDVMDLASTPSGHVALTCASGENIRIDKDALIGLDLENLTDEEALEILLQKGAIKNEVLQMMEESRAKALRSSKHFALSDEHYDEFARVDSPKSQIQSQMLRNQMITSAVESYGGSVSASSTSDDKRIEGRSSQLNIGTGENIRVEVRFNQRQLPQKVQDTQPLAKPKISVADIPRNIKEKLLELLRAHRKRRKAAAHAQKISDAAGQSRRESVAVGGNDAKGKSRNRREENEEESSSSKKIFRGASRALEKLPGLKRSTKVDKSKKKKHRAPKKAWQDPNELSPDSSPEVTSPYLETAGEGNKPGTSERTSRHFKDATDVLKYTEMQRQTQARTRNARVRNKKAQSDIPVQRLGAPYMGVSDGKGGAEHDTAPESRTSSSAYMASGWQEEDLRHGVSSHLMSPKGDSYAGEFGGRPQVDKRGRVIVKKERLDHVKRPARPHHSKQIDVKPLEQQELEPMLDTAPSELKPMANVVESKRAIAIADASHWLDKGSSSEMHRFIVDKEVNTREGTLQPLDKVYSRPRTVVESAVHAKSERASSGRVSTRAAHASSAKDPGAFTFEDEFTNVTADIRADFELFEFGVFSPPTRSDSGTDREEGDSFGNLSSLSPKSILSFSDLQEVIRLPVSNAFTFSFYALPKQHKTFNDKIKQAAKKIDNKNKAKFKGRKNKR